MIEIKFFNASLAKVMAAAGEKSLVQLLFSKEKDGKNTIQLTCCDAKGLQIMMTISYDGEPVEGIAIVNGNQLLGILRSYEALGFTEFSAKVISGESENVLLVSNGKGEHKIPLSDRMASIDLNSARTDAIYAAVCNAKALQAAVKSVSYAVGNDEHTAGIYFRADDKGYTLMATDCHCGSVARFAAESRAYPGKEDAERSFFAGKSAIKAIGALHGEAANMVITPKYILLKDVEGTIAVASLNGSAFPVPGMSAMLIGKNTAMSKPHYFDALIKKDTVLALCDLADAMVVTKESKVIRFRAVKTGETAELFCGTQAAAAEISSVEAAEEIAFSTSLLKEVLGSFGENVFIRFFKGAALFYKKESDECVAFLMMVSNAKK